MEVREEPLFNERGEVVGYILKKGKIIMRCDGEVDYRSLKEELENTPDSECI